MRIPDAAGRWLLLLLTANPDEDASASGLAGFNEKFVPRRLVAHTRPGDYPDSYFLALLEVVDDSA